MEQLSSDFQMLEEDGVVDGFVLPENKDSDIIAVGLHESVTPISPTKKLSARLTSVGEPPESPDMKFARNRLGTLLTSIRKGDVPSLATSTEQKREEVDKRGPGRPRKLPNAASKTKSGEVIFELRGKPFALREDQEATQYQLARAWMRGKQTEDEQQPVVPECDPSISMDLLATKDVFALPRAQSPYLVSSECPEREMLDKLNENIDVEDIDALRNEYSRHWKNIKRSWKSHQKRRKARYHRTIGLLETIYNIAQQSHS